MKPVDHKSEMSETRPMQEIAERSKAMTDAVTVWNPGLKDSVGYNGEVVAWSGSLELYNLGHGQRIFAPNMRMFYQMDTLAPFGAGGVNGYQYCHNNPIVYVDPTGHMSWASGIGIALAVFSLVLSIVTLGAALAAGAAVAAIAAGVSVILGAASTGLHIGGVVARESGNDTLADKLDQASLWTGVASAVTGFGAVGLLGRAGGSVGMVMRSAAGASRARTAMGFGRMARNITGDMELGAVGRASTRAYAARTAGAFPAMTAAAWQGAGASSLGRLMAFAAGVATVMTFISGGIQASLESKRLKKYAEANVPPPSPYTHTQEQP